MLHGPVRGVQRRFISSIPRQWFISVIQGTITIQCNTNMFEGRYPDNLHLMGCRSI